MDSLTHTLVGVSIGFIALKTEKFDSEFYVFLISILGSVIPDLDIVTRLFGKLTYLKSHRSLSHNWYMWGLYGLGIASISLFFNESYILSVILVIIACTIHVLMDSLNSYGVKFTPKGKWYRVGLISTIDIFIMLILILHIVLNVFYDSFYIELYLFITFNLYFLFRTICYMYIKRVVNKLYNDCLHYEIFSATHSFRYEAIIEYEKQYVIYVFYPLKRRVIVKNKVIVEDKYLDVLKDKKSFKTFTKFSPYYYSRVYDYGLSVVKIKFTDLRYHKKNGFFYFNCIYIIDKESLEVVKEDLRFSLNNKNIIKKYWI